MCSKSVRSGFFCAWIPLELLPETWSFLRDVARRHPPQVAEPGFVAGKARVDHEVTGVARESKEDFLF